MKRAAVVQQEARSSGSSGSSPPSAECYIGIKGYWRPPEDPTSWVLDAQLVKWLEPSELLSWPRQLPFPSVGQRGCFVDRAPKLGNHSHIHSITSLPQNTVHSSTTPVTSDVPPTLVSHLVANYIGSFLNNFLFTNRHQGSPIYTIFSLKAEVTRLEFPKPIIQNAPGQLIHSLIWNIKAILYGS